MTTSKIVEADIAVIGAGVVGCGIARELAIQYPNKKIVVLEKLAAVGLETSSHNSGVLHSGIHQNPNFLKTKLAKEGSRLAADYLTSRSLPVKHCGMLIAVSTQSLLNGVYKDWLGLWHLWKNGRTQNIRLKFLTPFGLKRLEPNVRALGGILIPDVWVIDPLMLTNELKKDTERLGAQFFFDSRVTDIHQIDNKYCRIFAGGRIFTALAVINAAGLYADEIAKLAGFSDYKIYPWRGEYYEVIGNKQNLVSRLIYPVLPPGSPSKGIHFSPRVDGRLFIGPNARPVPSKDYYSEDKTPAEVFLKVARQLCPGLKAEDLKWAYSGIRAKLSNVAAESDFIIKIDKDCPLFVNLIGIDSPGIASGMAIAKYVAKLIKNHLPA